MRWEALLVAATGLRLGAGIAWTTLVPLARGLTGAAPHISAGAAVALVADTVLLGLAAAGLPTRALLRGHPTEAAAGRYWPFTCGRGHSRCSGPGSSVRMNRRPRIRRHGPTAVPDPPPRVALETSRCSSASSTRRRKRADTFAWRPCH